MKKIKKLFYSIIFTVVALFTLFSVSGAKAAGEVATINYNVYTPDAYAAKLKYNEYWWDDFQYWFLEVYPTSKSKSETVTISTSTYADEIAAANALWADPDAFPATGSDTGMSCYEYYDNQNPLELLGSTSITITYTTNNRNAFTEFICPYPTGVKSTQFSAGDSVVVEPVISFTDSSTAIISAYVALDVSQVSDASTTSDFDFYILDKSVIGANVCSGSVQNGVPFIGFGFSDETVSPTGFYALGAIGFDISSSASGTVQLGMFTDTSSNASMQNVFCVNSTSNNVQYSTTTAGQFNDVPVSLTIGSGTAEPNTDLKTVTLDGTSIISNTSNVTANSKTYVQYSAPTGTTYNSSNVTVKVEPTASTASITNVRYISSSDATAEKAITGSGTTSLTLTSSNSYSIPISAALPGGTVYVAVDVQDGTTPNVKTTTYVIAIPKSPSTVAQLDGLDITSDSTALSGAVKWHDGTSYVNTNQFASGTISYNIAIASDTTELTIIPTFDTDVYQTCYLNSVSDDNELTNGVSKDITAGTFKIIMKPQSGTNVTYTFTVETLSADTTMTKTPTLTIGGTSYTLTGPDASGKYTVSNVPYCTDGTTVKVTPYLKTGQTAVIKGGTDTVGTAVTTNTAYVIPGGVQQTGYAADTETYELTVTAPAGNTYTYYIEINRNAADNTTTMKNVYVIYNSTQYEATDDDNDGKYTVSGLPYSATISTYTVKVVLDKTTSSITIDGTSVGNNTASSTKSFAAVTPSTYLTKGTASITITAENTDSDTYTLEVLRDGPSQDVGLSSIVVNYNGQNYTATVSASDPLVYEINDSHALPYSASISNFNVTVNLKNTDQNVTINGNAANPSGNIAFTNNAATVSIIVTAQDTTCTETYTLNVKRQGPDQTVTLDKIEVTYDGNTYEAVETSAGSKVYELPAGTTLAYNASINYFTTQVTLTNTLQTCKINGTAGTSSNRITFDSNQEATVTILVTAQDTTCTETYTLNVKREGPDQTVTLDKIEVTYDGNTYEAVETTAGSKVYELPAGTTLAYNASINYFTTQVTLTKSVQTCKINGTAGTSSGQITFDSNQEATVTILVKAQDTTCTETYTLNVKREGPSDNNKATTIKLTDSNGTSIGTWDYATQTFTAPTANLASTISYVKLDVTKEHNDATLKINGAEQVTLQQNFTSASVETLTFTVVITAQNGDDQTWTISVKRDAANDDISFTITGTDSNGDTVTFSTPVFTASNVTTSEQVAFEISSISFTITPTASTTKVFIGGDDYTGRAYTYTFAETTLGTAQAPSIRVVFTTEANSTGHSKSITLKRAVAQSTYNIDDITITDELNSSTTYTPTVEGKNYSFIIDQSVGGSKFSVVTALKADSDKAKMYISTDANDFEDLTTCQEYSPLLQFNIKTPVYLKVVSQYGTSIVYTILTDYKDTRSTIAEIKDIDIAEVPSFTFNEATTSYTGTNKIIVGYNVSSVTFDLTLNDALATLTDGSHKEGVSYALTANADNTFTFQAQAENTTSKSSIYTIVIYREQGQTDDYITGLKINGIDAFQTNVGYNTVAFNEYSNAGFAFVIDRTLNQTQANIVVTVSNGATFEISTPGQAATTDASYRVGIVYGTPIVINISVKSQVVATEGGNSNTYSFTIYPASQDYKINDINILKAENGDVLKDVDGYAFNLNTASKAQGPFVVPYVKEGQPFYLSVEKNSNFAQFQASQQFSFVVNHGTDTKATVKVISEYQSLNPSVTDQCTEYEITVRMKEPNENNKLDSLKVTFGDDATDKIIDFNPDDTGPYQITGLTASEVIANISITKQHSSSVAKLGELEISKGDASGLFQKTLSIPNNSVELTIEVTSEKGETRNYKIIISKEEVVLSGIYDITSITAMNNGTNYFTQFNPTNFNEYTIELPATVENLDFTVTMAHTGAIALLNDAETLNNQFSVSNVPEGGQVKIAVRGKAENGDLGTPYSIVIKRALKDGDATLSSLTFNGTDVTGFTAGDTSKSYTVYVANTVTEVVLGATPTKTTSKITTNQAPQATPYQLAVGDNILTVVCTAQNDSTETYTVNVVRDAKTTLDNFEAYIDGANIITNFATGTFEYPSSSAYQADFADTKVDLRYTLTDAANASELEIEGAGEQNLIIGEYTYTIKIKARSGAFSEYKVKINRAAGKTEATIKTFTTESGEVITIQPNVYNYHYRLEPGTTVFAPIYTVAAGATHQLLNNTVLTNGYNVKEISVKSEDESTTNTYTFEVYVASNDFDITDINVLKEANGSDLVDLDNKTVVYNKDDNSYELRLSYAQASAYLEILTSASDAVVMVNGSAFTNSLQTLSYTQDNVFTIYAISKYGQLNTDLYSTEVVKSPTYKVTIEREAPNSDPSLASLSIKAPNNAELLDKANAAFTAGMAGLTQVGTDSNGNKLYEANIIITEIGSIASVVITFAPTDASTTVVPALGSNGTVSWTLNDTSNNPNALYTFEKTFTCTATDGSIATYKITLTRGPLNYNDDNTVTGIEVYDSKNNVYLDNNSFDATNPNYGFYEIPYGIDGYTIAATKNQYSLATLYCVNSTDATDTGLKPRTIGTDFYDEQYLVEGKNYREIIYIVYAISGSGQKGQEYQIKLRFLAPSNDNTLSFIKVDSVEVPGFTPETTDYELTDVRTYTTTSAEFKVSLSDANAKIISINGEAPAAPVAGVYTQNVALKVGTHIYKIVVQAQNGNIKEYNIQIQRDSESPYLSDLAVSGEILLNAKEETTVFNKAVTEYRVIVTYITVNATIAASVDNVNYTMSCTNSTLNGNSTFTTNYFDVTNLEVGENNYTITVRSSANKVTEYKLTIIRRSMASMNTDVGSIDIVEVPEFKEDYDDLKTVYDKETYAYTVPNKVVDLDVIVNLKDLDNIIGSGATYEIYNATGLKVGDNKVIILVTAEDGKTTKAIIVDVYRKEMEYEFDKTAYAEFEVTDLEKDEKGRARYEVNLNNKNASAIEDFTKYIKFDAASNNITVKEVTDKNNANRNEVVLEITDGDKTEQVVIQLNTTANNGNAVFDWGVWILLAVAIIILIIILIAVNRDKYGSVTHKRKKLD